jgi:phospholipid/cholesterol/gamma-HCH transport system ATP-binding protein
MVVSYDATEALKIVDYVYFLADGVVAAEGATAAVKVSTDPFVHQFIRGQPDGPVPFHYPSGTYADDMDVVTRAQ